MMRATTMRDWVGKVAELATISALAWTTGCAGFFVYPGSSSGGTGSSSNDYVYVANATTQNLAGYVVGTGTLTSVTNSPYTLGFSPTAVAVTPADTFVYVSSNSLIYGYSIGTGGALTILNSGSALGIANVAGMDVSPDGNWLFVIDGNNTTVDEFKINTSTGALTQTTGASYTVTGATVLARDIKVAPNGAYVFAALGLAGDLVFPFNTSTGVLSSPLMQSTGSTTASDNALAVNPASTYLYIARSGTGGGLAAYSIGTGGALTPVAGSPFTAGTQPHSVVVNATGTDVYLANRGDGTISGYSVATNGTLAQLSGSPYTSGSDVAALARDKSASYLFAVADGGSPDLTMYAFDSSIVGKLDLSATTATGTDPTGALAVAVTH